MIWHVVHIDFDGVADSDRREIEAGLEGLTSIAQVAWLRVSRDIEQPSITGLLTAFETAEDLATYRTHPAHVPVVERIRDVGAPITRFDIEVDDDASALP